MLFTTASCLDQDEWDHNNNNNKKGDQLSFFVWPRGVNLAAHVNDPSLLQSSDKLRVPKAPSIITAGIIQN